jgi:uncharacterized phage-like protein YoqJ
MLGITGHRTLSHDRAAIQSHVEEFISARKPQMVYIGMAIGFDTICALACLSCNIPYTAMIPCEGQDRYWSVEDKLLYPKLLNSAAEIVFVNKGYYAAWKMHVRNKAIVDKSNEMLVYYNGIPKGGTFSTISYATKRQKFVTNIYDALTLL